MEFSYLSAAVCFIFGIGNELILHDHASARAYFAAVFALVGLG